MRGSPISHPTELAFMADRASFALTRLSNLSEADKIALAKAAAFLDDALVAAKAIEKLRGAGRDEKERDG